MLGNIWERFYEVLETVPGRDRPGMRWSISPDVQDAALVAAGADQAMADDGARIFGYPVDVDEELPAGTILWTSSSRKGLWAGIEFSPCVYCGAPHEADHEPGCLAVVAHPDDLPPYPYREAFARIVEIVNDPLRSKDRKLEEIHAIAREALTPPQ